MLASALGLFLAGGMANAQNWVPSKSPYGTWKQPAPASAPAPASWRNPATAAKPQNDPPATKDTVEVLPPPPVAPAAPVVTLPPSAPAQDQSTPPAAPVQIAPPAPVQKSESLPPLPPPPSTSKAAVVIPAGSDIVDSEQSSRTQTTPFAIKRAEYQPPAGLVDERRPTEERTVEQIVQLEPPGPERVFRLESEASLNERMRQEGKSRIPAEAIAFPEEPNLAQETYPGRHWPPQVTYAEPYYVCYGRLLFEDRNSERFGWDFGILQPVISTGKFYADLVTLPYHVATAPCRCYECSAGLCLPGDPVPYLCYPPELSATGAIAEAGSVLGLLAIFP
jgi:hypothetical protein